MLPFIVVLKRHSYSNGIFELLASNWHKFVAHVEFPST